MGSGGGPSTPEPTAQERALAEKGVAEWQDFKTRFQPLTNDFIERTRTSEGDRIRAGGSISADSAIANRGAAGSAMRHAFVNGKNAPTMLTNDSLDTAATLGKAQGQAVQAADDQELDANLKLSAFSRGLSDDADISARSAAADATRSVIQKAENKFAERNAWKDGLAAVAGAGVRKYANPFKKNLTDTEGSS